MKRVEQLHRTTRTEQFFAAEICSSSGLGHHPFTVSTWVRIPYRSPMHSQFAQIAQPVEHRLDKAVVVGSIPTLGTKEFV
jgi:hypothetical protein